MDFFRSGAAAAAAGRPAPRVCLLSHAHSDHLAGLNTHRGPFVYCSAATRALVLRLTRRPGRLAFARGEAEARARPPYRHLRGLLKALPLDAPTRLETGSPGHAVQVTLLDANHCVGAVMFRESACSSPPSWRWAGKGSRPAGTKTEKTNRGKRQTPAHKVLIRENPVIEGDGKAVLYTGDVRAEPWWVNSLVRHPALVEYTTAGLRMLDRLYLDTSNVADVPLATKAEGLGELLRRVAACPSDVVFYLHAWTYGYEDVWMALAKMLQSRVSSRASLFSLSLSIYSFRRHETVGKGGEDGPPVHGRSRSRKQNAHTWKGLGADNPPRSTSTTTNCLSTPPWPKPPLRPPRLPRTPARGSRKRTTSPKKRRTSPASRSATPTNPVS